MTKRLLRIIFFLFCMEIFLRIGGFVVLRLQDYRNHFNSNDRRSYRILCLGESMTFGSYYPQYLEEILNKKHLSRTFQVVNKGISGITSGQIVGLLEPLLNKYKPDMVIVMMGLADEVYGGSDFQFMETGKHSFSMAGFFHSLRVYKLFRGLCADFKMNFIQTMHVPTSVKALPVAARQNTVVEQKDISPGTSDENVAKAFFLGVMCMQNKKYPLAETIFRILAESLQAKKQNTQFTFYHYLAIVLYRESKYKEMFLALQEVPYQLWYDIQITNLCSNQEYAVYEIASLGKLYDENPKNAFFPNMIYQCYEKLGDQQQGDQWKQKARALFKGRFLMETKANYLKLLEILKKREVMPVLMQYPLRDLETLEYMVQSASDQQRIVFIDNQKTFQEAVNRFGYDLVFNDHHSGDFGHFTPQGSRILAEHVADVLIKSMGWK